MRIEMFHSDMFLRDDGIIQVNVKNHNYSLQNLKDINRAQGKICNGKRRPLLVLGAPFANVDADAREFMASEQSTQYSSAEAFVINSLGQKILANFYLKVNKPGVPTRFFTEQVQAEEWLRNYLPSDL
jgi:hypothetical protein